MSVENVEMKWSVFTAKNAAGAAQFVGRLEQEFDSLEAADAYAMALAFKLLKRPNQTPQELSETVFMTWSEHVPAAH